MRPRRLTRFTTFTRCIDTPNIDYIALYEGEVFAVYKEVHPDLHNFFKYKPTTSHIDVTDDLSQPHTTESHISRSMLVPDTSERGIGGMVVSKEPQEIIIDYTAKCVGEDEPVEEMDVLSQQGSPGWTSGKWRDHFLTKQEDRDRIRNVIALETSQVESLGKQFVRSTMVRELDLSEKVWPQASMYRTGSCKFSAYQIK